VVVLDKVIFIHQRRSIGLQNTRNIMTSPDSPRAAATDNTPSIDHGPGRVDERGTRLVEGRNFDLSTVERTVLTDTDAETASNADLYIITPPAYTRSIAEGEQTVTAAAVQEDKPPTPQNDVEHSPVRHISPRAMSDNQSDARPTTPLHVLQERARERTGDLAPTGPSPALSHHLTHPAAILSLVGARTCSILQDRPAIWLVRNKKMALSPLAAAVLVKEGLLNPRDLELSVPSLMAPFPLLTMLECPNILRTAATLLTPSRAS
jgi:hypothetical protein